MVLYCSQTCKSTLYIPHILYIYIPLHWGMIHGFLCLCRCEISKNLCCRNLAVEKAVSELPTECTFCLKQFPRSSLERHQKEECQDRYTAHTHIQIHKNTFSKIQNLLYLLLKLRKVSQTLVQCTNDLKLQLQHVNQVSCSGCFPKETKQKYENRI